MDTLFASSFQAMPSFRHGPVPSPLHTGRLRRFEERLFERRPSDRLFLAALPDAATAARIVDLAGRLKTGHGLKGRVLRPEHLRVTLFHVRDGAGLGPDLVDAVTERVASVVMPSFRVTFDRVGSFRNGAFVLRGDAGMMGLEVLHQRLSDAFDGRPASARPFTPHVTLLRDRECVEEHAIEPIEWTVGEVVLVRSPLGRTEHHLLTRLPLAQVAQRPPA